MIIINLPVCNEVRKTPHKYGEKTFDGRGIHLSRFGASWRKAGGKMNDRDGFITWMMNIPFIEDDGSTVYISQDDAEDAYWMMRCGKVELEYRAGAFIREHGVDERGYVIIKELE